jgi:hypothetical protein
MQHTEQALVVDTEEYTRLKEYEQSMTASVSRRSATIGLKI